MHVAKITRRHGDKVYVSHLIRRSVREGRRVRHETIANVSKLPPEALAALRRTLAGETLLAADDAFEIERSLPHGHVQALLSATRRLSLERLLDRRPSRERSLCVAMICQRILRPGSKLRTARSLSQSTLAAELAVEGADEDELYAALDWLAERQGRIERTLARRHLAEGTLVLYDVSSSYFEGRTCPLASRGYSRDERRHSPQIVYGLLCDSQGRPVAVEVFEGHLHDHQTVRSQLEKLKRRFGLRRVIVVSDRGMVTSANLEALRAADGLSWISALRAPQVKRLVRGGAVQLSLFDEQSLAEVDSEQFPGERLIVCRNPLVAAERARKRSELLAATEAELEAIRARVEAGTLSGKAQIGLCVGEVWNRFKVRKHFSLDIADDRFDFSRKQAQIAEEAALDGVYVLRTAVPRDELAAPEVVRSYKRLARVERDFRELKGPELEIRPIHHRLEGRVRAHVFLCMLVLYLEWHLRRAFAELLFHDEQHPESEDPVAKAERSVAAERKARTKRTAQGERCHSFRSLLDELALLTRSEIRVPGTEATFQKLSRPSAVAARALELAEAIESA